MEKIADIRTSIAFREMQNFGFVPIKFTFRDTYSWGMESTSEVKIKVQYIKKDNDTGLNVWQISYAKADEVKYHLCSTNKILAVVRKFMETNRVTYHLLGHGQYTRRTTGLNTAITELKAWAMAKELKNSQLLETLFIDVCSAQLGTEFPIYDNKDILLARIIKNY